MDIAQRFGNQEKKLRENIVGLSDHNSHALGSVCSCLWLQFLGATMVMKEHTEEISTAGATMLKVIEKIDRSFNEAFGRFEYSTEDIRLWLCPISVFATTYPTTERIQGSEYLFNKHPDLDNAYGINAKGTELLHDVARSFLIRQKELGLYKWAEQTPQARFESVSTEIFAALCIRFAIDNASCASTDDFLASMRSRFIARSMNKRGLYAWGNRSFVKTKDFYLCMREIEPDRINTIHHLGSTPILVALEDKDGNDTLKQIIAINIVCSFLDTEYWEDA